MKWDVKISSSKLSVSRILGQEVTKTVTVCKVLTPEDASRVAYWGGEKKVENETAQWLKESNEERNVI